jgi:hypothetical protein
MPQQRDLSRATHVSWHGFSCGYLIHSAVLTGKTPTVNDKYVGIQTLIFGLQAVIFLLQLFVFAYQAWKLRQTVEVSTQQSADMKESIKQATRAATAMEKFAEAATVASTAAAESVVTVKDSMSRQLRAYLCVNFATAGFQNTETKFRFEVRLNLLNAGFTPG